MSRFSDIARIGRQTSRLMTARHNSTEVLALVFRGCHRRGGVERSIWELARHLQQRHAVAFVGTDFDAQALDHVRHLPVAAAVGPFAPAVFRRRAAAALEDLRPTVAVSFGATSPPGDVLYVNSVHRRWISAGAGVRVGRLRVPNAARRMLPRHQLLLALERSYFRGSQGKRVVAVSGVVRDDLAELYSIDPAKVTVIPNGFAPDQCSLERRLALRGSARARAGFGPEDVVLLLVANELHRKGLGVLLDAVALTGDERLRIVIAGKTPPAAYTAQMGTLSLTGRVDWLGPVDDIGLAHAMADWFVLPTQYEAFALAVVEALASGLPVLTTNVPGAGDLIEPGVNGYIQGDPLDSEELANLLRAAASLGAEDRAAMGQAAARSVRGLSWGAISERVEAVIAQVR